VSGLAYSSAAPTFGFIPTQQLVLRRLPAFVPLMVREGITGDHYLPYTPETPRRTLTQKFLAIPASEVRYEYSKPFAWVAFPDYFKRHAHEGEKYAELADLFWQMLEAGEGKKLGHLPNAPLLGFDFSSQYNQKISQLAQAKMRKFCSAPFHYEQELTEFIEASSHSYQIKHGVPLPVFNKNAVNQLFHQAYFGPKQLQQVFALTDMSPQPIHRLMHYIQLKMQGRLLMDRVFPGQSHEQTLKRKNRLYAFEQIRADFDFGAKTTWEKVTLGFQKMVWAVVKPFVARKEHWQKPVSG
jgi:hypothetical protein